MSRRFPEMSVGAKLVASAAVLAAAAALVSVGAFATFTSSVNETQSVSSGVVAVSLGAAGTSNNRLSVGASDIAPGDSVQRVVTLTNTGTLGLSGISLTTAATQSSLLDTDGVNGLQMKVEDCPQPWTESGGPAAYSYTCAGATTILASRPVVEAGIQLAGLGAVAAGGVDYLRVTLTLPTSAGNSFQGLGSTIRYTFQGVQRAGRAQ